MAADIIDPAQARTLHGLFQERARRSPDSIAYRYFDHQQLRWCESTWHEMALAVARWQTALQGEGLSPGDRVAIMLGNCREWVMFEQAALGLGLVVVPLFANDRPDNVAYILDHAGVGVLLIQGADQWAQLAAIRPQLAKLKRVVVIDPIADAPPNFVAVRDWLPLRAQALHCEARAPGDLATIVYTSGTTGRPKGVMLSHHNILWNAHSAMLSVACLRDDLFLSFLPLSHTLERSAGYYLPMMAGATVAFARSIPQLAEDLVTVRPTVLISVPRIFERVAMRVQAALAEKGGLAPMLFEAAVVVGWHHFLHAQHREAWHPSLLAWPALKVAVADKILGRFGGRVRVAVCGGAPLSASVAKIFVGLGLPLVQGYGMTETSPVVSVNPLDANDPASVGVPLQDVEVRIGADDELLVRSPGVMLGYWRNPEATRSVIDADGWLHTGDKARIENSHIYITGRLKDIIVLANGEKVPPADMEAAILDDPLFEQAMVAGEGRPYLAALVVVNKEKWRLLLDELSVPDNDAAYRDKAAVAAVIDRIARQCHAFPGYAQIRRVAILSEPWTVEGGLLTPTLKLRRTRILEQYKSAIDELYAGH